jgi:hypothetical protein
MACGMEGRARRGATPRPGWRSFVLGVAAGMGIWLGLMGPGMPLVGPHLGQAIARAERAPLRWIPTIWLAGERRLPDPIPPRLSP